MLTQQKSVEEVVRDQKVKDKGYQVSVNYCNYLLGVLIAFILGCNFSPEEEIPFDFHQINSINRKSLDCIKAWKLAAADSLAREAVIKSQTASYRNGEALACNRIALVKERIGEADSAFFYFRKNLKLRQEDNNTIGEANTWLNIGNLYNRIGQLDSAQYAFLSGYALVDHVDSLITAHLAVANGKSLYFLNYTEDAEAMIRKGIEIYEKLDRLPRATVAYLYLGRIQSEKGQLNEALGSFEKALETAEQRGSISLTANAYNSIGKVYFEMDNYDSSKTYFAKVLELPPNRINPDVYLSSTQNLGVILKQDGKLDSARTLWNEVIADATDMALWDLGKDAAENLYLSFEEENLYQSHRWLKQYLAFRDSAMYELTQADAVNLAFRKNREEVQEQQLEIQRNKTEKLQLWLAVFGLTLLGIVLVIIGRRIQKKRAQAHEWEVSQIMEDHSHRILNTMISTQEAERRRISEDLHNHVATMLSSISQQLKSFAPRAEVKDATDRELGKLTEVIGEVRSLSRQMFSGALKHGGLVPALKDLSRSLEKSYGIHIQVNAFDMEEGILKLPVRHSLFLLIEGLLSNIMDHSEANNCEIIITKHPDHLSIVVADNGVGFDVSRIESSNGIGLKILDAKVHGLGGNYVLNSKEGGGTTISFNIPLEGNIEPVE